MVFNYVVEIFYFWIWFESGQSFELSIRLLFCYVKLELEKNKFVIVITVISFYSAIEDGYIVASKTLYKYVIVFTKKTFWWEVLKLFNDNLI